MFGFDLRQAQGLKAPGLNFHNLLEGREPTVNVLTGLIFRKTVSLLQPAFELVTFSIDRSEIIVSELAPLFLYFALELFPISFDSIPVLDVSPSLRSKNRPIMKRPASNLPRALLISPRSIVLELRHCL
jgi:hypothetical protein